MVKKAKRTVESVISAGFVLPHLIIIAGTMISANAFAMAQHKINEKLNGRNY
jgi:hypothetical protein